MDEGQTTSGNLLDNDSDMDAGDVIEVSSIFFNNKIENSFSSVTLSSEFGTLEIDSNGNYSFTANSLASIIPGQTKPYYSVTKLAMVAAIQH